MGESGYAISSWSASAGYSASMLIEDAKVDSSSTRQLLPSSVNISAEYPALPDHDSMNNPSVYSPDIPMSLVDCQSVTPVTCHLNTLYNSLNFLSEEFSTFSTTRTNHYTSALFSFHQVPTIANGL